MANYKEIVTKAVIGKGKKTFTNTKSLVLNNNASTILGCWVINHNFKGEKVGDTINASGSYDVNIWYSYEGDSKTEVVSDTVNYSELVRVSVPKEIDVNGEEVIVRSIKQPTCTKAELQNGKVNYVIENELGIEVVGDVKLKITDVDEEDDWEDLDENIDAKIDKGVDTVVDDFNNEV
ncbi:MAG: outer spore coat protein CotE [Bacilli bacterium]